MISNTSLTMISAQIAALSEEKKELAYVETQNKEQSLDFITDYFLEMGGALALLKSETSQLTSSNLTLKGQLDHLKAEHIAEIDGLINNQLQMINLTAKKIENLIESILLIKLDNKYFVSESSIESLKTLHLSTLNCGTHLSIDYPEDVENIEKNKSIEEYPAEILKSESILIQNEPVLKEKIQKLNKELQILNNEIIPLRNTQKNLIQTQQSLVSFHQKHLVKVRQACKESITKLSELLLNSKTTFFWESLITFNASVIKRNIIPHATAERWISHWNNEAKKISDGFQQTMEAITSSFADMHKEEKGEIKS